jgi:hypothetical protein
MIRTGKPWSVYNMQYIIYHNYTIYRNYNSVCAVKKTEITAVGICCDDHATPLYPLKLALTSQTSAGRSVGVVRSRTKATE